MSADLWAAFGSPHDEAQADSATQQRMQLPRDEAGQADSHSDADSWSAVNEEIQSAWYGGKQSQAQPAHSVQPGSIPPSISLDRAISHSTIEDDDFGDFEKAEQEQSTGAGSLEHSGVLVSAAEAKGEDEDDFGDFEEVQPAPPAPSVAAASAPAATYQAPSPVVTKQTRSTASAPRPQEDPFGSLLDLDADRQSTGAAASTETAPQPSTRPAGHIAREVPVLVAADDDGDAEAWDDFETGETTQSTSNAPATTDRAAHEEARRPSIPTGLRRQIQADSAPAPGTPPPTNIPPPSVLLSLTNSLIEELPEQIRVSIVETWEDDEADVQKHVEALKVAARIIAGRKLRWKRDTALSQSMRIGMAGRQGGMKLAGVDRAESQREDREAAELVRTWRQTLGTIRTALAEAGTKAAAKPPALPPIAENVAVRTVRQEEGGVSAARCCVLCGLKRDERAERVDVDVWDQFGEWWTEHWGHVSCKAFWEENEQYLQQR